jgi:hypothetical protein
MAIHLKKIQNVSKRDLQWYSRCYSVAHSNIWNTTVKLFLKHLTLPLKVTLHRNYPRWNSVSCYIMTVQNSIHVLWMHLHKLSKLWSSFLNTLYIQNNLLLIVLYEYFFDIVNGIIYCFAFSDVISLAAKCLFEIIMAVECRLLSLGIWRHIVRQIFIGVSQEPTSTSPRVKFQAEIIGTQCHIIRQIFTDVSEEPTSSMFRLATCTLRIHSWRLHIRTFFVLTHVCPQYQCRSMLKMTVVWDVTYSLKDVYWLLKEHSIYIYGAQEDFSYFKNEVSSQKTILNMFPLATADMNQQYTSISWLRHYATSWKVAGSSPDEVI